MLISTKRSYSNHSSSGKDGRSKKVHCKARPAVLGMTIGAPTYRSRIRTMPAHTFDLSSATMNAICYPCPSHPLATHVSLLALSLP